jgi:hypothetical protein
MKAYPLKNLIFLPALTLLLACSSNKKLTSANEEKSLPELPLSELDISMKIAAAQSYQYTFWW